MNVTTIQPDIKQAREKLKAYRAARHRDAEVEYKRIESAYQELAKGFPLINIADAIREGGVDENGFPKLAFSRADKKEILFYWQEERWTKRRTAFYDFRSPSQWRTFKNLQLTSQVSWNVSEAKCFSYRYALVPMVPPDVRPKNGQLKDWHILWEVNHWSKSPQTAKVSPDPYLLRHIDGDLYAVIASWDLTPLEEMILNAVRSERQVIR